MAETLTGPMLQPADGGAPRAVVVFLHGYGADGEDLAGLMPYWAQRLPHALLVAPNAPEPCEANPFGRQWFSLPEIDPIKAFAGARAAAPLLDAWLDALLARCGLGGDRLVLAGFSQGALMALHVGLRRSPAPAAIVAWSGWLAGAETLGRELKGRPPTLLVHGTEDPVVPFASLALGAAALKAAGVPVEALVRPGLAHGIDQPALDRALGFAVAALGAVDAPVTRS
jgi:phospholipase/carboxylesterase